MTQPTAEQVINKHRIDEINILARTARRAEEQQIDDNELIRVRAIIETAQALTPKPENPTPPNKQGENKPDEDEDRTG